MDLETEAAQRVGTTLCNKWTLERLIGTGGMAAVYVAAHKIGRREAIKILHSDVARDPELRARFEQEANAVNRFKHPGTVEVRDIDVTEDGSPFLVMELLDGQSLAELARQQNGVGLGELLRMVDEMLDVLAAAHAQGIIHRDIKPDNLFVLRDGRLKVLDFGIARVRAGAPSKLRTKVGATLGTAPYMPPEQIRGAEIDARADLFAVGATMFRLIARRRIHEAANEAETLVKMASAPAPPLASAAPDAPRDVCLIVDRALMFDREQRYPDAVTMQGDVRAVRAGQPPPWATARLAGAPASTAQPPTQPATPIVIAPPSSSAAITPDLARGEAQTAAAPPVDPRTMAASPTALNPPPQRPALTSDAVTLHQAAASAPATPLAMTPPPASVRVPVLALPPPPPLEASPAQPLDPATRPAMMVLGAAGLGAPLASTPAGYVGGDPQTPGPAGAAAANPALATPQAAPNGAPPPAAAATSPQPAPVTMGEPPKPPAQPAAGERTLRSVQGPEGQGHAVEAQGYSMATTALPQVTTPTPVSAVTAPGPRTQLSGVAPPQPPPPPPSAPLAPGESIPVMPAPPRPKRRYTLPGTDMSVWPLVGVGVLFAAIGVAITLYFMLRGPNPEDMATYPIPTSAPTIVDRPRPAPHTGGTSIGPSLGPQQPPTKGPIRHPR